MSLPSWPMYVTLWGRVYEDDGERDSLVERVKHWLLEQGV